MKNKICIVGLGYIGLPTAAMLACEDYEVIGVDVNKEVIDNLNKGKIIIKEPYLDDFVSDVVKSGKLKGSTTPCEADVFIICVPTPITEDKKSDLRYVIQATNSILPYLKKGNTVILESTSPVGTTKNIIKTILEKSNLTIGKDIYLGYSPERVLPGKIIEELVSNHRVVGGINEESALRIKDIYKSFVKGEIYTTDTNTAEMVKLVENTFRDLNIAFSNELCKICDELNMNVWDVIKFSNKHPRVDILNPGPGVGGHCLAVDPWFIVESSQRANIINLARNINDSMPEYVFSKIEKITQNIDEIKKISIFGITYKPDIDDMRESPIIHLVDLLKLNNYEVSVYDPYVKEYKYLERDLEKCIENSDLIVMGVGHEIFKFIDYSKLLKKMKNPIILDTINFLEKEEITSIGFEYNLLGTNIKSS